MKNQRNEITIKLDDDLYNYITLIAERFQQSKSSIVRTVLYCGLEDTVDCWNDEITEHNDAIDRDYERSKLHQSQFEPQGYIEHLPAFTMY